jgi:predicted ATPase
MIRELYINNFKSLLNFRVELAKFVCFIGTNGAGKSTLLQAIDFITQIFKGDLKTWLQAREWQSQDLLSYLKSPNNMIFEVKLQLESTRYAWYGEFNLNRLTCTKEKIINETSGDILFEVINRSYRIGNQARKSIEFKYQGSALSALFEDTLTQELLQIRSFLIAVKSFELLSPQLMRKPSRQSDNELGLGGNKLSAFLHGISNAKRDELNRFIKGTFSTTFESIETITTLSDHKRLFIEEKLANNRDMKTEASHISDGLLRIMAILSQTMTAHTMLLFDEIENGINPEWVEALVDLLVQSPKQIIVTTHSPMVLNYLADEQAKKSVIFIYKNKAGISQQCRFFSIAGVEKKLDILGPGEAMVDVNLSELAEELNHD